MSTGMFLRLDSLEALTKTFNDRLTKVETEVTQAGGDATLSTQVTSLRADLTNLQNEVGTEDASTPAPAPQTEAAPQ